MFRCYRRQLAGDEWLLQDYIDDGCPEPPVLFGPYSLKCLACGTPFTFHTFGTLGRNDLSCSDACASRHDQQQAIDKDWEECIFFA